MIAAREELLRTSGLLTGDDRAPLAAMFGGPTPVANQSFSVR